MKLMAVVNFFHMSSFLKKKISAYEVSSVLCLRTKHRNRLSFAGMNMWTESCCACMVAYGELCSEIGQSFTCFAS